MAPSGPPSNSPPTLPASQLGIIHLLGWITGIAIVLAMYRAVLDAGWLDISDDRQEETRWWQLGYGLVYGTAISSLGLLCWRRLRGDRRFPSQPGHWLLVFGGLAFLADAAAFPISHGIAWQWQASTGWDPGWFWFHQTIAWGIALLVASVAVARLRTGWNWRLLAVLIAVLIGVNWLTHTLCVLDLASMRFGWPRFGGSWSYHLAFYAHVAGLGICLAAMPLVLGWDRHRRDWLHWAGVVATIGLAVVELALQLTTLLRAE